MMNPWKAAAAVYLMAGVTIASMLLEVDRCKDAERPPAIYAARVVMWPLAGLFYVTVQLSGGHAIDVCKPGSA